MVSSRTVMIVGAAIVCGLLLHLEAQLLSIKQATFENAVQIAEIQKEIVTKHDSRYRDIIHVKRRFKFTNKELQCLAKNIYYEAGTEDQVGKYAVATVTINRLKTKYWGKSVCDVVYAKAQFSWTGMKVGKPYKQLWAESMQIAKDAMNGARVRGLTHSLYYHADYIQTPDWAEESNMSHKIGAHIFYTQAKNSWLKI